MAQEASQDAPAEPAAPAGAGPAEPGERAERAEPGAAPELTNVRNFRDVGGLPTGDGRRVRPGVLFRSGHLAHATEDDTAYLAGLGLHTVFDFRNRDDIALEGQDTVLPGTRNVNLPLSDPAEGAGFWHIVRDGDVPALRELLGEERAAARMTAAYRRLILERTEEHGRVLAMLADDRDPAAPALMHCAAGKDRAGTTMAIVLLALGVRRSAIEQDYLESNARHRRYKVVRGDGSTGAAIDPEVRELLAPLFEARLEYLHTAFATIEERWGSVDRYLEQGLGLGPERRALLQERFLTDGGRAA